MAGRVAGWGQKGAQAFSAERRVGFSLGSKEEFGWGKSYGCHSTAARMKCGSLGAAKNLIWAKKISVLALLESGAA